MSSYIRELWERVKRSDAAAWAELVERYSGLVYTVARRVGLTSYDAEDCAQHTWLSLYRNRAAVRHPERLPAWLIMTTKRQAIRMCQRRKKTESQTFDIDEGATAVPPDEELLRLETQDALEHALEQIDPRCRKLLAALFLSPDRVSYRQIARSLGIAPNSLGPIRARCLKRLKKIMESMGY